MKLKEIFVKDIRDSYDSKEAGKGPPWLGPAKTGGGVSFTRRRKERSNVERVALPHKCVTEL